MCYPYGAMARPSFHIDFQGSLKDAPMGSCEVDDQCGWSFVYLLILLILWLCQNCYWTWPFIVSFPIKKGGCHDISVVTLVYQRVYCPLPLSLRFIIAILYFSYSRHYHCFSLSLLFLWCYMFFYWWLMMIVVKLITNHQPSLLLITVNYCWLLLNYFV